MSVLEQFITLDEPAIGEEIQSIPLIQPQPSTLVIEAKEYTFQNTEKLPDGSTITASSSDYLTTVNAATIYLSNNNAASTYASKANPTFTGTVTFPDGSTISSTTNNFLNASYASYVASTFAPLEDPTFTGAINLNGNVSLAQTSANTLTSNDHLVLCTGSNFTTPVSGQQGYI